MLKSKTLIMIPAYNAEKFMKRTIDSCLNQTLPTEVWIVDNCSTDTTQSIVKEYEKKDNRVKLFINDKNYGRVGNWNRCLELFEQSKFEYLKFLFTGDELLPECIADVENIFMKYNNLSVVIWPYIFVESDKKDRIVKLFDNNKKMSTEYLYKNNFYPSGVTGAIVCNTYSKFATKGERFNEELLGAHTFSNRCVPKGDVYHINKPLSIFNLDGHNSYSKQFSYLNILEMSFTKALGLENSKSLGSELLYELKKYDLLENMIHQLIKFEPRFFIQMQAYVERNKDKYEK